MFRPTFRSLVMTGTGCLGASRPMFAPAHAGGRRAAAAAATAAATSSSRGKIGRAVAPAANAHQGAAAAAAALAIPPLYASSSSAANARGKASRRAPGRSLITPPVAPKTEVTTAAEDLDEEFSVDAAAELLGRPKTKAASSQRSASRGLQSVIDDPELAALVEAHKARHGAVEPLPPAPPQPSIGTSAAIKAGRQQRTKVVATEEMAAYEDTESRAGNGDDEAAPAFGVVEEATEADMDDEQFQLTPFTRSRMRRSMLEEAREERLEAARALAKSKRKSASPPNATAGVNTHDAEAAEDVDGEEDMSAAAEGLEEDGMEHAGMPRGAARSGPVKRTEAVAAAGSKKGSGKERKAARALGARAVTEEVSVAESAADNAVSVLTNPFRGIHGCLSRSYRLDQLLDTASVNDALFARQEKKSGAFSFLQFKGGKDLYEGHWGALQDLQAMHQRQLFPNGFKDGSVADMHAVLRKGGIAVPGFSLFNNDLGLHNPRVTNSFPLLLAQRLLLFPDGMRHFHALCGRENVPCDFFADVDLPDVTPEEGEKVLLEIINYLEVRLPGVGFTDPFFLILTNAEPSNDKVSYHIHARSMTYRQEEADMVLGKQGGSTGKASASASGAKGKKKKGKSSAGESDALFDDMGLNEEDDDLTDLVNVVDGAGKTSGSKKNITIPKVIAFQDYRTVKLLGEEVNQTIGKPVIDDNCYRVNGMLRCAFSAKLPSNQDHDFRQVNAAAASRKRLVPLITARDSALRQKLSHMEAVLRTMTDPEILELSFCNRYLDEGETTKLVQHHLQETLPARPRSEEERTWKDQALRQAHKHKFKLLRPRHILGPQSAQAVEYDAYGNMVSPYLTEAAKWKRYNHVVQKLRTLTPRAADSYDVWVRIGLALHNFSNEDHVFEEWVRFSLKCPQKYSREVCRKKWVQFERNPDALNWRRGFNYLNSTVWRQV